MGSVLFPRVDNDRVVLFFSRWWTADGSIIGVSDLAALFYQACERAGRTPKVTNPFFGYPGWEVRPQ